MRNHSCQLILHRIRKGFGSVFLALLTLLFLTGFLPGNLGTVYASGGSIYLDGIHGNDSHDGESESTAVKTFEKAKDLATDNQDIETIYILGTVSIQDEVTLEGTNAHLERNPGYEDYLLNVSENHAATLRDIRVDGGGENSNLTRKSLLNVQGDLEIQDGTVLENNIVIDPSLNDDQTRGGAIYAGDTAHHSVIDMTGGVIQNNLAGYGGGIYLASNVTFNMSGGVIQKNTAHLGKALGTDHFNLSSGGGIASFSNSTINLSGDALITQNESEEVGGGISVGTLINTNKGSTLNMTGGTVSENRSASCGAGIYVSASNYNERNGFSTANISAGKIIDNVMTNEENTGHIPCPFGGGGIYVNGWNKDLGGTNGVLNLKNALIKDNKAENFGGGYAGCPIANTEINVKNGVAIIGNRSIRGSEIYLDSGYRSSVYGLSHIGAPNYAISPLMLGGTAYRWRDRNNKELPLNKLKGKLNSSSGMGTGLGGGEELILWSPVQEDSAAESLATVLITGNYSATGGGGIGSNGDVYMGERDLTEVKVVKTWNHDDPAGRPESITVELYRKSESDPDNPLYIGSEVMKEDPATHEWKLSFKNLPKKDENGEPYQYFVKERPLDGYACLVSGSLAQGFKMENVPGRSLLVEKRWIGESTNEVEILLLADGVEKESLTLSNENDWKASFSNLPKFSDGDGHEINYKVKEVAIEGYSSSISGNMTDGYIVTNTKATPSNIPERPDPKTPSEPPSTPTHLTPGVMGENREAIPNITSPKHPEVAGASKDTWVPETGDHSLLFLWGALFSLSLLATASLVWKRAGKKV